MRYSEKKQVLVSFLHLYEHGKLWSQPINPHVMLLFDRQQILEHLCWKGSLAFLIIIFYQKRLIGRMSGISTQSTECRGSDLKYLYSRYLMHNDLEFKKKGSVLTY